MQLLWRMIPLFLLIKEKKMIRKNDVLSILFELGGCDARDDYYKGYDDAIDLIEREVLKLKEINLDDTCENIK